MPQSKQFPLHNGIIRPYWPSLFIILHKDLYYIVKLKGQIYSIIGQTDPHQRGTQTSLVTFHTFLSWYYFNRTCQAIFSCVKQVSGVRPPPPQKNWIKIVPGQAPHWFQQVQVYQFPRCFTPSLESISIGKEVENAFFLNGCYGMQTVAREITQKNLHHYILFSSPKYLFRNEKLHSRWANNVLHVYTICNTMAWPLPPKTHFFTKTVKDRKNPRP